MYYIPDICFPNLTILSLHLGDKHILLPEFKEHFPKMLKNMVFIEQIELWLRMENYLPVCQYVAKHYGKYCITANVQRMWNCSQLKSIIPWKILTGFIDLSFHPNDNYLHHLQYIQLYVQCPQYLFKNGWDRYQEFFDQCTNLKVIEFNPHLSENFFTCKVPNECSEFDQQIWKKRLSYFQSRGIRIANRGEIESFRKKLEKEAGITWSFELS